MRFALLNSGLGLLATASELHKLRPDADLVLAMDPDGMPWGPRSPQEIAERSLTIARAAAEHAPDAMVMACNTATVHALDVLRAEFEPDIPIIGTVPAIKPAAAAAESVAIWATVATTASEYQRAAVAEYSKRVSVTPVPCPGLASAVDAGDADAIAVAIADAASRTPRHCSAIVLGCTEYELVADMIRAALPGVRLFGSASAVAAQVLKRAASIADAQSAARQGAPGSTTLAGLEALAGTIPLAGTAPFPGTVPLDGTVPIDGTVPLDGTLRVILSGRRASLPAAAMLYPQGRLLAQLEPGSDSTTDSLV